MSHSHPLSRILSSAGRVCRFAALTLAMAVTSTAALAQSTYPTKPVNLVVGFPAGTNPDLVARELAKALGEKWSQPVIVVNRPGAGGVVATESVSREPADGYTLYLTSASALVSAPFLYKNLGYDPLNGLTPIAMVVSNAMVLITSGSGPYKTFKEFVSAAKAKEEGLSYGMYGTGSLSHVAMEKLQRTAGIRLMQISYGSSVPITDVVNGTVDVLWSSLQVASTIDSGRLLGLAYSGSKRNPRLPNVPTVGELGYPEYEASVWYGLIGPAGLSPDVIHKVASDIEPIVASSAFGQRMQALGNEINFLKPQAFKARIASDYASHKALFEELNVQKQ